MPSRLGYDQSSTTMIIYAHALQETDRKAVGALETMLTNTPKNKTSRSGSQMVAIAIRGGFILCLKVKKTPGIFLIPGVFVELVT